MFLMSLTRLLVCPADCYFFDCDCVCGVLSHVSLVCCFLSVRSARPLTIFMVCFVCIFVVIFEYLNFMKFMKFMKNGEYLNLLCN